MVRQTSRLIESHRGRPGKVSEGQLCTLGKTLAFYFGTFVPKRECSKGHLAMSIPITAVIECYSLSLAWVPNSYGQAERDPCAPVFEQTLRP